MEQKRAKEDSDALFLIQRSHFMVTSDRIPFNLGLAAVACEMLYKVDSLAEDKDMTLISQALLTLWGIRITCAFPCFVTWIS